MEVSGAAVHEFLLQLSESGGESSKGFLARLKGRTSTPPLARSKTMLAAAFVQRAAHGKGSLALTANRALKNLTSCPTFCNLTV